MVTQSEPLPNWVTRACLESNFTLKEYANTIKAAFDTALSVGNEFKNDGHTIQDDIACAVKNEAMFVGGVVKRVSQLLIKHMTDSSKELSYEIVNQGAKICESLTVSDTVTRTALVCYSDPSFQAKLLSQECGFRLLENTTAVVYAPEEACSMLTTALSVVGVAIGLKLAFDNVSCGNKSRAICWLAGAAAAAWFMS